MRYPWPPLSVRPATLRVTGRLRVGHTVTVARGYRAAAGRCGSQGVASAPSSSRLSRVRVPPGHWQVTPVTASPRDWLAMHRAGATGLAAVRHAGGDLQRIARGVTQRLFRKPDPPSHSSRRESIGRDRLCRLTRPGVPPGRSTGLRVRRISDDDYCSEGGTRNDSDSSDPARRLRFIQVKRS